ncbi:MAG: hypothetical protein Q7R89_00820 [bacterium]|nr:hypothetical protein [bacterium]
MDFQKINEVIEKSPQETKDLLFSDEIGQFLQDIAQQNNLDEETSFKLVDEVGYLILGLKERSSFKNTLGNIGIPKTAVLSIIQEVSKKIFAELDKIETNKMEPPQNITPSIPNITNESTITTSETKPEPVTKTSVPEIPPTNLPMVEKGEVAHNVAPAVQPARQDLAGSHTVESKPEPKVKAPLPDYRYPDGQDPYREPLK